MGHTFKLHHALVTKHSFSRWRGTQQVGAAFLDSPVGGRMQEPVGYGRGQTPYAPRTLTRLLLTPLGRCCNSPCCASSWQPRSYQTNEATRKGGKCCGQPNCTLQVLPATKSLDLEDVPILGDDAIGNTILEEGFHHNRVDCYLVSLDSGQLDRGQVKGFLSHTIALKQAE